MRPSPESQIINKEPEMNNSITEIKNILERTNSRLENAEHISIWKTE